MYNMCNVSAIICNLCVCWIQLQESTEKWCGRTKPSKKSDVQYESEEWQILQRRCKSSVSANFGAQEEHEAMKLLKITF